MLGGGAGGRSPGFLASVQSVMHRDHKPKPRTLDESRRRAAAMPRLLKSIQGNQPKFLTKAELREAAVRTRGVEGVFRFRLDIAN